MNSFSKPVTWALRIAASALVLLLLAAIPSALALITGNAKLGEMPIGADFTTWVSWYPVSHYGIQLLVVGAVSALLLLVGRWPSRLLVVAALAWFIGVRVAFDAYWTSWEAAKADLTPYAIAVVISGLVLAALSLDAFLVAARTARNATSPPQTSADKATALEREPG